MDSKHSDDDYIINDTEYEEDEADIAFDKQEKSKKKNEGLPNRLDRDRG